MCPRTRVSFFIFGMGWLFIVQRMVPRYISLSSSLSENKHETVECILLWCPGGGPRDSTGTRRAPKLFYGLWSRTSEEPVPPRRPERLHPGVTLHQSKDTCPPHLQGSDRWCVPPRKASWDREPLRCLCVCVCVLACVRVRPEDGVGVGARALRGRMALTSLHVQQLRLSIFILGLFKG